MIAYLIALSMAGGAEELDRLLEEAVALKAKGDLVATLDRLRRAEQIRPHFRIAHNIGAVLEELGRYGEAAAAYQKVVGDRATPAEVAAGDVARLATLEAKLTQAWIIVHAPAGGEVYVGGEPVPLEEEVGVPPGAAIVELWTDHTLLLLPVLFTPALRAPLDLGAPKAHAVLALDTAARANTLEIDGHAIRGVFGRAGEIWIAPGDHTIAVELVAEGRRSITKTFEADTKTALSALFPPLAIETPIASAEPADHTAAFIVGGVGVAATIAAAIIFASGDADRRTVHRADMEGEIVTGLTMREADLLLARARTKTTAGRIAIAGAAALLAAGAALFIAAD